MCVQILILKNLGIYFYSGFSKNGPGGGVQIEILKIQVYTFSGLRKNVQGGGVQFQILNII